jgi:lysozyme family protein
MHYLKAQLIGDVIAREGGYVNDPTDRGGETMYGITKKVARENDYLGQMKYLPYALAVSIYQKRYWDALRLNNICTRSHELAKQLFDFGVNSGVSTAGKCLQKVLNVLNQQQALYPDLVADGILGTRTLTALIKFEQHRKQDGLALLAEVVRGQRISFCVDIAIKDQTQERYQYGWLNRIVHL